MISAWWLLLIVPAIVVAPMLGAFGMLVLIDRIMLQVLFKRFWR